jgi:hypothetical protein
VIDASCAEHEPQAVIRPAAIFGIARFVRAGAA